jgi:hypothetical protein
MLTLLFISYRSFAEFLRALFMMTQVNFANRRGVNIMADDNKKHPFQDDTAAGEDQQKGGEASATDEDVAALSEDSDVPTDTSELEEDTATTDVEESDEQS